MNCTFVFNKFEFEVDRRYRGDVWCHVSVWCAMSALVREFLASTCDFDSSCCLFFFSVFGWLRVYECLLPDAVVWLFARNAWLWIRQCLAVSRKFKHLVIKFFKHPATGKIWLECISMFKPTYVVRTCIFITETRPHLRCCICTSFCSYDRDHVVTVTRWITRF